MKTKSAILTPAGKRKYIAERAKKLWDLVREERKEQLNCGERPYRQWYEEAWEKIEPMYEGAMKRDDDEFTAPTPMDALLFYIESCMYPPPEVMQGVYRCYEDYLLAGGEMTLEEAFFGPSKPKVGNRAKQWRTDNRYYTWSIRLRKLEKQGYSRTKAAELIANEYDGRYDPESILRLVNRKDAANPFTQWAKNRTKKPPV